MAERKRINSIDRNGEFGSLSSASIMGLSTVGGVVHAINCLKFTFEVTSGFYKVMPSLTYIKYLSFLSSEIQK